MNGTIGGQMLAPQDTRAVAMPALSERIAAERVGLEERLEHIKRLQQLLAENPTLKEALDLVQKIGAVY